MRQRYAPLGSGLATAFQAAVTKASSCSSFNAIPKTILWTAAAGKGA